MEYTQGFLHAYGWNVYYQKILGFCPENNESIVSRQRAWFWCLIIFVWILIPQIASLWIVWGDLNACIICLSTNISIMISVSKIALLQYHRNVVGWIAATVNDDWTMIATQDESRIMLKTARISRSISILSFSFGQVLLIEYFMSRLWKLWQGPDHPGVNPDLNFGLVFDVYFPFDTSRINRLVLVWLAQCFGIYLSAMAYSGPDSFVSMAVLHVCCRLRIIRHSLRHLVDETTVLDSHKYWNRLAAIVKRHEQLNHLSDVIRDTFSTVLLVQMVASSVIFCLQGYVMFMTLMDRDGIPLPVLDLIFAVIYAFYTATHLFICCWVGDQLFVESTGLADDFYETEWYNLAPNEAKAFVFVSHRSKNALEIKAGKFCTFNLQLFNAIIKNSMGYLSMLMAMKDRLID